MIDTKDKEIERLKDDNKYLNKVNIELSSEKNRLHSIIKEVRELLSQEWYTVLRKKTIKQVLEILDKENNNE